MQIANKENINNISFLVFPAEKFFIEMGMLSVNYGIIFLLKKSCNTTPVSIAGLDIYSIKGFYSRTSF
jgi:hypothetical protein